MILFSPLTPLILLLQSDATTAPTSLIASLIALLNGIGTRIVHPNPPTRRVWNTDMP